MKKLEEFVNEHRAEFDGSEPAEGHFDRFASKLMQDTGIRQQPTNRFHVLKLAAVILLLITVGVAATEFVSGELLRRIFRSDETSHLTKDMKDAISYYDGQTLDKLEQLEKLARTSPDVKRMQVALLRDISNLDASTNDLKKSLGQNPGNERIQAAIIQNQQMKESIVTIILQNVSSQKLN